MRQRRGLSPFAVQPLSRGAAPCRGSLHVGKGQMGSALTGSLQISFFFLTQGLLDTPVISSKKCQGAPFFPICKNHYLCSGPISVDPICPQPSIVARFPRCMSILKGWHSHVHRGFPGKLESSNLSREILSREIGCYPGARLLKTNITNIR